MTLFMKIISVLHVHTVSMQLLLFFLQNEAKDMMLFPTSKNFFKSLWMGEV